MYGLKDIPQAGKWTFEELDKRDKRISEGSINMNILGSKLPQ